MMQLLTSYSRNSQWDETPECPRAQALKIFFRIGCLRLDVRHWVVSGSIRGVEIVIEPLYPQTLAEATVLSLPTRATEKHPQRRNCKG